MIRSDKSHYILGLICIAVGVVGGYLGVLWNALLAQGAAAVLFLAGVALVVLTLAAQGTHPK